MLLAIGLLMFAAGWYASEKRFTQPVEVPLKCDGGGSPSWPPTMPQ